MVGDAASRSGDMRALDTVNVCFRVDGVRGVVEPPRGPRIIVWSLYQMDGNQHATPNLLALWCLYSGSGGRRYLGGLGSLGLAVQHG